MKKVSIILLGMLTLPTYANIASTEYTDAKFDVVSDAIELKANKTGYSANKLLQTDTDGKVTATTLKTNMIENGAVTNSKLASGIGLDKLAMGTLPTSGKHILIWNSATNKYVFEEFKESAGSAGLQCPAGQYDIGFDQCADLNIMGNSIAYWGFNGNTRQTDTYGLTEPGQWAVKFYYGTVKGIALCSSTQGTRATAGNPNETPGSGNNCWCKMTSPSVESWVYCNTSNCSSECADACASNVRSTGEFRGIVLTGEQMHISDIE